MSMAPGIISDSYLLILASKFNPFRSVELNPTFADVMFWFNAGLSLAIPIISKCFEKLTNI
jgi:hypothetical protein